MTPWNLVVLWIVGTWKHNLPNALPGDKLPLSWGGKAVSVGSKSARIRFGPYELDPRSGELSKFGRKLRLQEQPFQILVLLLDRRGDVVTRDDIQKRLWSDDTFVDFDHSLNNAIKRLRETLCDSADKPRYIETLPRRGYRFIAQVELPETAVAPLPADVPVAAPAAPSRIPLAALVLLAVLVVATAGIGDATFQRGIRSIAVLPLENLSGDSSQDYFATGLTDALTTELARTVGGSIRVTSRTSADKYRNKPLSQIVRDLDVDA